MQTLRFYFIFILTLAASGSVFGTPDSLELIHRPAQISFFPPMSTNGLESHKVVNNLSVNIIAGYNGGLEGIEVGGFANVLRHDMKGAQLAGFGNTVLGNSYGTQMAGFYNYNRKYTMGAQFAGFANVVTDTVDALQAAGFVNVNTKDSRGVQIAGFSNVVVGATKGAQVAGYINMSTDSVVGTQLAGFANVTPKDLDGAQVAGFLNVAKKVNGLQLGFININDTVESGVAIGFLNISRKGIWDFELETSESFYASTNLKTGSERLYSIFSLGMATRDGDLMWGYGYGLGTMFPIHNNIKMNVDLTSHQVQEGTWRTLAFNQLNRLKVNVSAPVAQNMKVYGGPTFNVLLSNMEDENGDVTGGNFAPYSIYNETSRNTNIKMYPGFTAGIRF